MCFNLFILLVTRYLSEAARLGRADSLASVYPDTYLGIESSRTHIPGPPPPEVGEQFRQLWSKWVLGPNAELPVAEQAKNLARDLLNQVTWARLFLPFCPADLQLDIPSSTDFLAGCLEGMHSNPNNQHQWDSNINMYNKCYRLYSCCDRMLWLDFRKRSKVMIMFFFSKLVKLPYFFQIFLCHHSYVCILIYLFV